MPRLSVFVCLAIVLSSFQGGLATPTYARKGDDVTPIVDLSLSGGPLPMPDAGGLSKLVPGANGNARPPRPPPNNGTMPVSGGSDARPPPPVDKSAPASKQLVPPCPTNQTEPVPPPSAELANKNHKSPPPPPNAGTKAPAPADGPPPPPANQNATLPLPLPQPDSKAPSFPVNQTAPEAKDSSPPPPTLPRVKSPPASAN